jgi:hypothetical protein
VCVLCVPTCLLRAGQFGRAAAVAEIIETLTNNGDHHIHFQRYDRSIH